MTACDFKLPLFAQQHISLTMSMATVKLFISVFDRIYNYELPVTKTTGNFRHRL